MAQSPWHTHYHVEPKTGLLNDPNGFSYFDGKWIVFYQNFPFGAAHGLKSWVQLESEDLVHFTETGVKVLPDTPLDSHGAYSGSAMQFGDNLFLFYTGNVRDENWIRHPYQIGAVMDKDGKITKIDKILIDQPADSTDHFRDPQIFNFKGQYYAIVGGQDLEKKGFVRLYKAIDNDYTNWQAVGDLDFANDRTAYMMECPNLVFVGEQPVLLYCPQGLDKDVLDYDNIYPNMYKIGASFDPENAKMVDVSQLQNMDYGFEAYATQAFNAPDGRVLAVSWLGLPDVSYPSDRFDHQGTFSLVKELTIKDGKLYQFPVAAVKDLRASEEAFSNRAQTKNTYELELSLEANSQSEIVLLADQEGKGLSINFDLVNGQVTVDRSQAGEQYAQEFGTTRSCPVVEELSQGQSLMGILSNYATDSLVTASCRIAFRYLSRQKDQGREIAEKIALASQFAQADPYRAATHNKGIFNGIDAVLIATGNDWRAIEAGAHAFASREGHYQGLSQWTLDLEREELVGEVTLPMPVATKGGSIGLNPRVALSHELLGNPSAKELAQIIVSIGLAQNFAALKALVSTGIQQGHMKLQAKSLALLAGASEAEVVPLVERLIADKTFNLETAQRYLENLRS